MIGFIVVAATVVVASSPTLSIAPDLPAPASELLHRSWSARWIAPPGPTARSYGVHHFRKTFDLTAAPASFVVNVSADNRYQLFVNGTRLHAGPERGELRHWRFDTLDLAPHLRPGRNILAAEVWNYAEHGPVAQQTDRTAFILQGNDDASAVVNTDPSWRVFTNPAYTPIADFRARLWTYIVVGPGDDVDGSRYPWGWQDADYDDSAWATALPLAPGEPRGVSTDGKWLLVPRQLPAMESRPIRFARVRRAEGVAVPADFLSGSSPVVVPPRTTARFLLDQNEHTTGFPRLQVSGGRGAAVTLTYAESLYEGPDHPSSRTKGHRDEVDGKHLRGFADVFRPDGGAARVFRPLQWRTWRYVQVDVSTADAPLTLEDLSAEFTAYPFTQHGRFASSDPDLARIWDLCWRTLRTGTHEIFTDSPYYEQLSYVGDTRIEALVALQVSGDDRPMRKAIEVFDQSRNANGLTSSRWPDSRHQIIPPYSLVWISMVHDYWRLRDDSAFVRDRLPGVREVLRYFAEHSDPATGVYTGRKWWNYIDWIPAWGNDPVTGLGGVPPRDAHGASAILDLQHVYTLQQAAELFDAFGWNADAESCRDRARQLRAHVLATCWDDERGLLADTPERLTFSQHANTYLILTAGAEAATLTDVARRMQAPEVTPATFYFSFYTHEAMVAAGLAEDYLSWLEPWRDLLDQGLTTVPETPAADSRSDSHAWGSHPILRLLDTVCGIRSDAPGFKSVRITPHLGPLQSARGSLAHPTGLIEVELNRLGDRGLRARVVLPAGIAGVMAWRGQELHLQPGEQTLQFGATEP